MKQLPVLYNINVTSKSFADWASNIGNWAFFVSDTCTGMAVKKALNREVACQNACSARHFNLVSWGENSFYSLLRNNGVWLTYMGGLFRMTATKEFFDLFERRLNNISFTKERESSFAKEAWRSMELDLSDYEIKAEYEITADTYTNTNTNKIKTTKENKTMNGLNLNMGKAPNSLKLTYFGTIAFNNKTYANGSVQECPEGFTLDVDMLYIMPAARNQLAVGDTIMHKNVAKVVIALKNSKITVVNLDTDVEEILTPSNFMGMEFYSKVLNPMGAGLFGQAKDGETPANPMANMLPFLLMKDGFGGKDNQGLMMMMMMQSGNNPFSAMMGQPTKETK